MPSASGGGTATMTRLAVTVPRSLETVTVEPDCVILRTGALRATREPSAAAMRSGSSPEPPTKRESWAAFAVPDARSNVPGLVSLPAVAMYQRKNSIEMPSASVPNAAWKNAFSTSRTAGMIELCSSHVATVCASSFAASLAVHGASTGIFLAISSMRSCRIAASARISGSGGTVPVYFIEPRFLET